MDATTQANQTPETSVQPTAVPSVPNPPAAAQQPQQQPQAQAPAQKPQANPWDNDPIVGKAQQNQQPQTQQQSNPWDNDPIVQPTQQGHQQSNFGKAMQGVQDIANAPVSGVMSSFAKSGVGAAQLLAEALDQADILPKDGQYSKTHIMSALDKFSSMMNEDENSYYNNSPVGGSAANLKGAGEFAGDVGQYVMAGGGSGAGLLKNAIAGGTTSALTPADSMQDRVCWC